MTENELLKLISEKPKSLEAQAYRLGRKLANLELQKEIDKVISRTKAIADEQKQYKAMINGS